MFGFIWLVLVIVLAWITVKKGWLYDPTHPNRPKKTGSSRWFKKTRR